MHTHNKTPFTPEDVNARLDEIRVAADAIVETEAVAVEKDFNLWLYNNFILEASQMEYLKSLGTAFSETTGQRLAQAFRARNKVTMEKGDTQLRTIKFIREEQKKNTTYMADAAPFVEDELVYFIS